MKRALPLLMLALLPGCAAAIPAVAVAVIGRDQFRGDDDDAAVAATPDLRPVMAQLRAAALTRPVVVAPAEPVEIAPSVALVEQPPVAALGGPDQAVALGSYAALTAYIAAPGLLAPMLSDAVSCGGKPRALVLDIDEAAAVDDRWEAAKSGRIVAVPGAREAVEAARAAGLAVVFSSARSSDAAVYTEVALDFAGLGPVRMGETLWLGDGGSAEARRAAIAERYCIVALAGDREADFGQAGDAAGWGRGWFLLPNPVAVEPDPATAIAPIAPLQEN